MTSLHSNTVQSITLKFGMYMYFFTEKSFVLSSSLQLPTRWCYSKKILEKFVFPVSSKDIDSAEVICSYSVSEKALKRKLEAPEDIGVSKKCLSAGYDSDEGAYSVKVNCVLNMEPKISASAASSPNPYSVLVSKDLMQVINPILKEMACEHLTTMDKVLKSVKDYIIRRKLFDPNNPEKVIVKNDELGSIFGLSEFTLLEIRKILEKFVFPVSSKDTDSAEVICSYSVSEKALKRKLEAPEDIGVSKKCLSVGYDSDESVYSVQTDHLTGTSAHAPQVPKVVYTDWGTVGLGLMGSCTTELRKVFYQAYKKIVYF
ncbi:SWIB domain-containing protein [Trichonephila clavipes]|nr:SWIB domain-containing protein [Trichonephila clavipes]